MAKRKRSHHKRRRIGAATLNPKNPLVMLAAVGAGYMLSDQIYAAIDKAIPTTTTPATATTPAVVKNVISDTVLGSGFVGLGALVALKMGKPSLIKTVAGGIAAGAGLKFILKDQGVVTGFPSIPVIGRATNPFPGGNQVKGYPSMPVVGKIPNQLKGYITSRTAAGAGAMGMIPNQLKGYTTSRMPIMAGVAGN